MNILKSVKDTKVWSPTKVTIKLPFQVKEWKGYFKKTWSDGRNKIRGLFD